jgi:hypothetical protein
MKKLHRKPERNKIHKSNTLHHDIRTQEMKRVIIAIATLIILIVTTGCLGKKSTAPLLVLATEADYGTYTLEILKTEGFHEDVRLCQSTHYSCLDRA